MQLAACDDPTEDLLEDTAFPRTANEDETLEEVMGRKLMMNKMLT